MKNKGFTLTELLVVIVLVGLLIALTIPAASKIIKNSKEKAAKPESINMAVLNGPSGMCFAYLFEKAVCMIVRDCLVKTFWRKLMQRDTQKSTKSSKTCLFFLLCGLGFKKRD